MNILIQNVNIEDHPFNQYSDGCLAPQLLGQNWAHQLGLGYIYDETKVQTAINSIYKYNWTTNVGSQTYMHIPRRSFAFNDEPGLFLLTYPKSKHLEMGGIYFGSEVWSGVEYAVAAELIYENEIVKGLNIVRGIHERYNPKKHNPWNEIESGDHYIRSLASWQCLLAISGFKFNGPYCEIGFAPKLSPADFKSFFSASGAWGSIVQLRDTTTQTNKIQVKWNVDNEEQDGLYVKTLVFEIPEGKDVGSVSVKINGGSTIYSSDSVTLPEVIITLNGVYTLEEEDELVSVITYAE